MASPSSPGTTTTAERIARMLLFALLLVCTQAPATASTLPDLSSAPGYNSTPPPPGPLDFGEVEVGKSANASIEISNTGSETLTVQNPLLGGANPGDFGLSTPFPLNINTGIPKTVNLSCQPNARGVRTATLMLDTNDPAQPSVTYNLTCHAYIVLMPGPVTTGLSGPYDLVASPDGKHLYVTNLGNNTLRGYSRDQTSGALSLVTSYSHADLNAPNGVAISPDGKQVFVTSYLGDALLVLDRNAVTGVVSFAKVIKDGDLYPCSTPPYVCAIDSLDGANGLAVSPDGENLYVVASEADAITVLSRTVPTGTVSYVQDLKESDLGVSGLNGAFDVAISPDGYHIYVVSSPSTSPGGGGTVALFDRASWNKGRLTYEASYSDGGDRLLDRPVAVSVNPYGTQVYVVSYHDDTLMVFDRNQSTGALTVAQSLTDGGAIDGLNGPSGVAVHPNGSQVYVSSSLDNALAVFEPDPASGDWHFASAYIDGQDGLDGLAGASKVTTTPNGKHVYVTGNLDNAVVVFGTLERLYLPIVLR